jgi:hypothetical protein
MNHNIVKTTPIYRKVNLLPFRSRQDRSFPMLKGNLVKFETIFITILDSQSLLHRPVVNLQCVLPIHVTNFPSGNCLLLQKADMECKKSKKTIFLCLIVKTEMLWKKLVSSNASDSLCFSYWQVHF